MGPQSCSGPMPTRRRSGRGVILPLAMLAKECPQAGTRGSGWWNSDPARERTRGPRPSARDVTRRAICATLKRGFAPPQTSPGFRCIHAWRHFSGSLRGQSLCPCRCANKRPPPSGQVELPENPPIDPVHIVLRLGDAPALAPHGRYQLRLFDEACHGFDQCRHVARWHQIAVATRDHGFPAARRICGDDRPSRRHRLHDRPREALGIIRRQDEDRSIRKRRAHVVGMRSRRDATPGRRFADQSATLPTVNATISGDFPITRKFRNDRQSHTLCHFDTPVTYK